MQQVTEIYGRENGWGALTYHKVASNQGCKFIRCNRSWKRGSSRSDGFSLSPAGSTGSRLRRFGFLGRGPNLSGFLAPSSVPTHPSPNTCVSPFTPVFQLSHSSSLQGSTHTCSYPRTPDSTPHKPLLDLFYPPQYNRSKKEIPIHPYTRIALWTRGDSLRVRPPEGEWFERWRRQSLAGPE